MPQRLAAMHPHQLLITGVFLARCFPALCLYAGAPPAADTSEAGTRSPRSLQKYCSLSVDHTLCRHRGIGPACGGGPTSGGVTEADKFDIVAAHNRLRSQVALGLEMRGPVGRQPPAANMMQLVWDEELASVAQSHADQCRFQHDCSECRGVERFPVGQNLYMSYTTEGDVGGGWQEAVRGWYAEVKNFPNTYVDPFTFEHSTGHYSQMLWATTTHVGCGFRLYQEGQWRKKLYTCNYGPAGNVITMPMYIVGPACSRCPRGSSCSSSYAGLCYNARYINDIPGLGRSVQYRPLHPQYEDLKSTRASYSNGRDLPMERFRKSGDFQYPDNVWERESNFRSSAVSSLKEQPSAKVEPWDASAFGIRLFGTETQTDETAFFGRDFKESFVSNEFLNSAYSDESESEYYEQYSDPSYFQDKYYDYSVKQDSVSEIENFFYDLF